MHEEHIFSSEHILQGLGHNTQLLLEVKSYPSLQLEHFVSESKQVLQFELHFSQILLDVK